MLLIAALLIPLAACGGGYTAADATALVKANLDILYLGQYDADYLSTTETSENDAEEIYQGNLEAEVNNRLILYYGMEAVSDEMYQELLDLQEERGLTYLFISHDMSVIRYTSNRVGVMYLGHLVEEAATDDLFALPMHPYSQVLLSAVPSANPHTKKQRIVLEGDLPSPINPLGGCVFHTRCPYAMGVCEKECPQMQEVMPGHRVACHLHSQQSAKEEPNHGV